jgi:ankyrin repeat protein
MNLLMGTDFVAVSDEVVTEALSLLLDIKHLSTMSQVLFISKWHYSRGTLGEEGEGFYSIHWMGRFGLLPLLERWIDKRYKMDLRDSSGRTPLSWAAEIGHEAICCEMTTNTVNWSDTTCLIF